MPALATFLIDFFRLFNDQIVTLHFNEVALFPKLAGLSVTLGQAALLVIELPSELADLLLVFLLVNIELKTMVLLSKLVDLLAGALARVRDMLLRVGFQSFVGNFQKLQLSFRLVKLVSSLL